MLNQSYRPNVVQIYTDSSLNEWCWVVKQVEGQQIYKIGKYPAVVTVNAGEYQAMLEAMRMAIQLIHQPINFLSDSQLVVNQVNGLWKCNHEHLMIFRDSIVTLLRGYPEWQVAWIPREQNLAGHILEGRVKDGTRNLGN